MYWKSAKSISITSRLVLIFASSTLLILSVVTGFIYFPLKDLLHQTHLNQEHASFLLTTMCIKKLFLALWFSAFILLIACYLMAKKSMEPIKRLTKELASISALSLNKRLVYQGYPKELQTIAATCNEMLFRVEVAFTYIKQFSASMAHELRNPIHYLQTATEITLAKPQSSETYKNLLQTHLEEYQDLTQLIDNLLFLTRSENGQMQLTTKKLSANDLIRSTIDYYQLIAQENEVEINLSGDAQIEVDEHLFKRVISNLIDNSLRYSNKKGKILITIEKQSNSNICILIKDNGIGIPKEHLPLLGQGFYRVDYPVNQENAGLGLGLTIAKSIIELHKGLLLIDSHLGCGTTVILTLKK